MADVLWKVRQSTSQQRQYENFTKTLKPSNKLRRYVWRHHGYGAYQPKFRISLKNRKLYDRQLAERNETEKTTIISTSYTSAVECCDVRIFMAAELISAISLDETTGEAILHCLKERSKCRYAGLDLSFLLDTVKRFSIKMNINDRKGRFWSSHRDYLQDLQAGGYGYLPAANLYASIVEMLS